MTGAAPETGTVRWTGPSGPRAAVQIEPGDLEDFQRAARLLIAHPLVTRTHPRPGALAAVRRWQVPLRREFARVLGYRLDLGRTSARLYRRAATTSTERGPFTRTGRALGPLACSYLCLTLAALEALGDQTTASRLADEVLRVRSGDDELPVDLTRYDQRKAFVDAVSWLEERDVLRLRDGAAEQWLSGDRAGDALYDVDRDAVSRLLVASPSVLRDVGSAADFLVEGYGPTDDAQRNRVRHRVGRRILEGPVVSYEDLDADELAYVRQRRSRLIADAEQLTGCPVEARAEGLCLVDASVDGLSAARFPAGGTETQAALLWGAALVAEVATSHDAAGADHRRGTAPDASGGAPAPPAWGRVPAEVADARWEEVVAAYGSRFKADYREAPERLRRDIEALLGRFGLLDATPTAQLRATTEAPGAADAADGIGWVGVHAALARYRPTDDGDHQPPDRAQRSMFGDEADGGDGPPA